MMDRCLINFGQGDSWLTWGWLLLQAIMVSMLYQQHVQEQLNAISFSRELIIKANYEDAASYHPWNWRDFLLHYFCSRSRIVRPSLLTNAGNGRQTDSHLQCPATTKRWMAILGMRMLQHKSCGQVEILETHSRGPSRYFGEQGS